MEQQQQEKHYLWKEQADYKMQVEQLSELVLVQELQQELVRH